MSSWSTSLVFGAAVLLGAGTAIVPSFAAENNDSEPAPASIGADIPLTYFGPKPSEVQRELIGPYQLLKAGKVDMEKATVTLPLYEGRVKGGGKVWYILTDTTDKINADALGLNHSAKLAYAEVGRAVRVAHLEKDLSLTFEKGNVDFAPERKIVPGEGENAFPPKSARPGSVGDADYTPLVRIENAGNQIYNAPVVAMNVGADRISFCDGSVDHNLVHDHVVAICPEKKTVTLKLVPGFSFARPVLYLSMDANDEMAAAIEDATYAPALKDITVGRDDGAFSAIERLFAFANGPTGKDNPQRQGLSSAIEENGRSPLNVFGGIPTVATDYSPLWDLNLGEWTKEAIDKGYRSRLTEEFAILGFAQKGWVTGPKGAKFGSTGIIVNCPVVQRFL